MSGSRLVRSRVLAVAAALVVLSVTVAAKPGGGGGGGLSPTPTPIQIFGAWHCSDDACTWATAADGLRVRLEEPLVDRSCQWRR